MYFFIGTISNIVVIGVVLHYRQLRRMPFNVLIIYRAMLDLATCCVSVPATYTSFTLKMHNKVSTSLGFCLLAVVMHNFCILSSFAVMIEIAILRVISVTRRLPSTELLTKTVLAVIISVNNVVIGLASLFRAFSTRLNICKARESLNSTEIFLWINTCILASYTSIICGSYAYIACYTKAYAGRFPVIRRNRYDIATYRSCILIVLFHVVCHIPYSLYIVHINKHHDAVDVPNYLFYFGFSMLSHAGNPFLLFASTQKFRSFVLKVFRNIRVPPRLFRRRVAPMHVDT